MASKLSWFIVIVGLFAACGALAQGPGYGWWGHPGGGPNSGRPMTDAEIDKLATERGELIAKMQSIHDKAFANFYNNVLNKEQRAKFDQLQASAGPGPGWGRWRRNWTR